jgi:hypothetical protein
MASEPPVLGMLTRRDGAPVLRRMVCVDDHDGRGR